MNNTTKKAGYLKGLLDSMTLDENSAGDKLLKGIVELLGDLSDRADIVDDLLADLNDYVESIDDDLAALEGSDEGSKRNFNVFDHDDEDDFDDFDELDHFEDDFDELDHFDDDSAADHLHILRPEEPAEPELKPEPLAGALCPDCMRLFFVSLDDPADAMYICPHCGKKIHPVALSPENAPVVEPVKE